LETGTLHGDILAALRRYFKELHSIELRPELYKKAALRFANDRKIKLWTVRFCGAEKRVGHSIMSIVGVPYAA